ncbi:MAG TPA: hypothetical protein VLK23_06020 [Thermodesulfobacteriota bacterium]|nr:hypothetical protein [Thermodesulfobacteriota bacterium]
MSRIPLSFYRIQFNPEFDFQKAREVVDYLSRLGISDICASPVLCPRFLTDLMHEGEFPFGREVWGDTQILLPEDAPSRWKEAITGEEAASDGAVNIGDILKHFPVALLLGGEKSFIANGKTYGQTTP